MRPKFLLTVLASTVLAFAALCWIHGRSPRSLNSDASLGARSAEVTPGHVAEKQIVRPALSSAAVSDAKSANLPAATNDRHWVTEEENKLSELSAESDPGSLQIILTDLTSPEPQLRKAALGAVRQFGSRDAIPYLQDLAGHTDDAREKVALMDAAEYLQRVSVTELREASGNPNTSGN